jgi:hypothetical protein
VVVAHDEHAEAQMATSVRMRSTACQRSRPDHARIRLLLPLRVPHAIRQPVTPSSTAWVIVRIVQRGVSSATSLQAQGVGDHDLRLTADEGHQRAEEPFVGLGVRLAYSGMIQGGPPRWAPESNQAAAAAADAASVM